MPPWKQAIAESKAIFSAEHNLNGHVQERTWGIAASPSGDCIATCITLHPSDAVANIVPHVQKCSLLLSPCDSNVFYALQNPTVQEGNLFCPPVAEDLYFNRLQHPDNQPKQWADSCVSLIRNFAPESMDLPGELDPVLLAESVRTKLYFETSIVKARFEVLAAMFKKDRRSISDKHHVILQGLMGQVSALASLDLHQGALGTHMAQCYAVLSDKLHAGETDEAAGSARNQEVCTICGQEIPMESIKWGRCSGGHQFQRCAVTMLPISDPSLNFFDDNSDDDLPTVGSATTDGQDINLLGRTAVLPSKRQRRSPEPDLVSQCDVRKSVTNPDAEGYRRLEPRGTHEEHIRFADTPATSFNGSVTELLSGGDHSSPPRHPSGAQVSDGAIGRGSPNVGRFDEQHGSSQQPQNEQVLAAHAIAHEITLQALMRDEETLDRTLQSFAPLNGGARASLLPSSLKTHDPRSPRHQTFVSPKSLASSSKKVHVVPAPIDTSAPRRSLPADIVRTPYPHMPENAYRKDLERTPPSAHSITSPPLSESLLTVSIRKSNRHSRPRVTSILIPAPNAYSATRTSDSQDKPHHLRADEFDDAQFFQQLRHAYRRLLSGPIRILSARSLKRIVVSGAASRAADAGYGWLYQPRSPRMLANKGLSDTFGEEKILLHFRNPAQGRARYAFVHWAHRLAAAPASPAHTPHRDGSHNVEAAAASAAAVPPSSSDGDLIRRLEQPEGLEFVMAWSVKRIVLVFLFILAASVAATLVWILLGRNTPAAGPSQGGFRGAGDRVAAGVMMGICLLLLGLSSMAAWLGVSWLVI
ncbi:hypothetical protein KC356_g5808 [Hortaea werneckii]|nr:hypothetical protein KC356_g5808 [Hortaea werneckii]